jgi:hypothetical protein
MPLGGLKLKPNTTAPNGTTAEARARRARARARKRPLSEQRQIFKVTASNGTTAEPAGPRPAGDPNPGRYIILKKLKG